jgi:hypothetical protein
MPWSFLCSILWGGRGCSFCWLYSVVVGSNMKYCAIISVIYLEYRLHYGKSLNGHKFHQYQQNEQPLPPQSIEHKKDQISLQKKSEKINFKYWSYKTGRQALQYNNIPPCFWLDIDDPSVLASDSVEIWLSFTAEKEYIYTLYMCYFS